MTEEGVAPDGRPWVHPPDRAAWRAWLIEHHETSTGVWLVGYRRATGKPAMDYEAATEELLCVSAGSIPRPESSMRTARRSGSRPANRRAPGRDRTGSGWRD